MIDKANKFPDYVAYDPNAPIPTASKIQDAGINNDTKALNRYQANVFTTVSQLNNEVAVHIMNDTTVTAGEKFLSVVAAVVTQPFLAIGQGVETGITALGNLTGWL